jgi:hypothetical protein
MKSILVFSSVLFISIAAIFQTNNIIVTSTLPNYAKPGETVDFEVMVSKGSLSGFSKLQMIFPEGFQVEAVDVKGGTFSFVDQKLKIIWVSLPADPKFSLKFKVNIKTGTVGSFPLEGQFSYIQDGVRSNEKFNTNIFIAEEKPAALANAQSTTDPANSSTETAESTMVTATASPASFEFSRALSKLNLKPSESTTVKLTVGKKGISGFGKITEIIPDGFTAEEIESNGAIFSVLNNEVRFLWMTLPASDSFDISYKLVAGTQEGEQSIKGSFSYVEDTKTRVNSTSATIFKVNGDEAVASATPPDETTTTEEPSSTEKSTTEEVASANKVTPSETEEEEEPETETEEEEEEEEEEPAVESATASTEESSNEVDPATINREVSYRVQICATRKAVNKQYFVKNNSVSEAIFTDMHDGWHKFTVGAFDIYGDARNHREDVKESNKITGPFVTAYNRGNRITVQEALMISKQQWVP